MSRLRSIAGVLVLAGVVLVAVNAQARQRLLREFVARYPNVTGTPLHNCITCHTDKVPALNPYGRALKDAGFKLEAIEKLDSDKDKASNVTEIRALTFPGDPKSYPGVKTPPDSTAADSVKSARPDSSEARSDSTRATPAPPDSTRRAP